MACSRYLTRGRSSLVALRSFYQPSIAYVYHTNGDNKLNSSPPSLPQTKSYLPFPNSSNIGLYQCATKCSDFHALPHFGASFQRHMSTANDPDLLSETSVQAIASSPTPEILNEVAVAAAHSSMPVAALQNLVDAVHSFTGFNWWVSIILTTFIMRGALLPAEIMWWRQIAKTSGIDDKPLRKFIEENLPKLHEVELEKMSTYSRMTNKFLAADPISRRYADNITKNMETIMMVFKTRQHFWKGFIENVSRYELGVIVLLSRITFALSFYLAISNMAEKVPSFETGGSYWFLDLSTPDSSLIFPLLTALTIYIELLAKCTTSKNQEYFKHGIAPLVVLSVLVTSFFPKALFFYWIPSFLFTAASVKVLGLPAVRLSLGLPQEPDVKKTSR